MFSYRYDIHDFNSIPINFLYFCSEFEETDDIVILNQRYNKWQGTTLAIPINDYKIDSQINDSIYILRTSLTHTDYWTNRYSSIRYPCRSNLSNLLKHIYPNASIIDVDYSNIDSTFYNDPVGYMETISNAKIIFCFSDYNPLYSSVSYADIKSFLDSVSSKALERNLDLYVVYTPCTGYTNQLYNIIESYVFAEKPRKIFNFYTELESTRDDLPSAVVSASGELNAPYSVYGYYGNSSERIYSKQVIYLFSRFILSNIFHKDREEYYVSLMYNSNPKSAYQQWINRADEYMAEDFHIDQYKHGGWSLQGKYGQSIFKENGQMVSVGVHTSYDPFLWMCEQGGITCKKEEDEQIEDLDLMGFYAFLNGSPNKKVKPPVFPTTGCPWFTISNKNITEYGLSDFGAKLYITRIGSSFILTIRLIHSKAQLPDVWQSITFGEFVGRQDGYNIDQFYCAGGNQALSPDSWTYFATSHIIGLQMDLDMKNSSLVNSNILHSAKFEKENMSNFRIMNSEGTWEDIYSATQGYEEYQYLDGNGNATIYTWGVPLKRPNFDVGNDLNTAIPYMLWQNKIDTYTINKYDLKKNDMSGKIDPLTVYLAK